MRWDRRGTGFSGACLKASPLINMKRITTTIKRRWLDEIVAGTKKIEERERKPYWRYRLSGLETPFELRLINGMSKKAPEATLLITDVTMSPTDYLLHIGKVLSTKNLK